MVCSVIVWYRHKSPGLVRGQDATTRRGVYKEAVSVTVRSV